MNVNSKTKDLKVTNLRKSFADCVAIKSFSFSVDSPEVLCLLGPSGSGKTTLLKLIKGLLKADAGQIFVFGEELVKLGERQQRQIQRGIAYLPQGLGLVEPLSAIENVLIGASSSLVFPRLGVWSYPKKLRDHASELLKQLGIGELAYRKVDSLSGGERQRVAIARCLILDPVLILADEPVASLDPETAKESLKILVSSARKQNLSLILTLHQPELAKVFADRVIAIKNGKKFFDIPASSLTKERVSKLYSTS